MFGGEARFELVLEAAQDDRVVVSTKVPFGGRMLIREGTTGATQFIRDQLERFRVYHFHDTSENRSHEAHCRPP